jgi:hypothetical protein
VIVMTCFHDELKRRRRRFLNDCRLCRWGSLTACDRALAYPYLGLSQRWDLLRQRQRLERWHRFRDRCDDERSPPQLPNDPVSHADQSPNRKACLLAHALAAGAGALLGAITWSAFPELLGF